MKRKQGNKERTTEMKTHGNITNKGNNERTKEVTTRRTYLRKDEITTKDERTNETTQYIHTRRK